MYTGRLLEIEFFGPCLWEWGPEYMPYRKAMARVKGSQPWDPTDPQPRMANDLHAYVCIAIGLKDWSEVALYTAVGSPLDFFHGIDGFFEFHGKVVTLDVTADPHKDEHKADVIIQLGDIDGGMEKIGQRIAQFLR